MSAVKQGNIEYEIDFSGLHAVLAQRIMRDWGMDEAQEDIFRDLLRQRATPDMVAEEVKRMLPSWKRNAEQLKIVMQYLANGGGE